MIAHAGLPVSNYEDSKRFYSVVLATLGYTLHMEFDGAGGFNDGDDTDFWIVVGDTIVPNHLAFKAKSKQEVEAFYDTALKEGATDNGKPGYREKYWPGYYAAFVLDKDGHNIEAVYYDYEKVSDSKA